MDGLSIIGQITGITLKPHSQYILNATEVTVFNLINYKGVAKVYTTTGNHQLTFDVKSVKIGNYRILKTGVNGPNVNMGNTTINNNTYINISSK